MAFRVRAYLAAPLQAEMQQLRQSLTQERSANRRWRDATERTLATHSQLLQEVRSLSTSVSRSTTSGAARQTAERCTGLALLVERLLVSETASITRIDPGRDSHAALVRAKSLMSETIDTADASLLIAWPEAGYLHSLPNRAEWLLFLAEPDLSVGVIDAQTGVLHPARIEQLGERAMNLFVTRAGSKIWAIARRAA